MQCLKSKAACITCGATTRDAKWFAVGGDPPPDGYFVGGPWTHLQLDERHFHGGHIETLDNDDCFGISADMGALAVVVSDANS
jgi:hypothetical protein